MEKISRMILLAKARHLRTDYNGKSHLYSDANKDFAAIAGVDCPFALHLYILKFFAGHFDSCLFNG